LHKTNVIVLRKTSEIGSKTLLRFEIEFFREKPSHIGKPPVSLRTQKMSQKKGTE
jgi:hypothetical protein